MSMNQITAQLDRIIARLRLNERLDRVKFIREHGNHRAEVSLSGFLAVVCVTDTALSRKFVGDYLSPAVKGERFSANVQIIVYAPADENGNGLSEITCELMQGLKKADTEKIIGETSVSAIEFDADMNAIYRKVEFTMEFCLCEEV